MTAPSQLTTIVVRFLDDEKTEELSGPEIILQFQDIPDNVEELKKLMEEANA